MASATSCHRVRESRAIADLSAYENTVIKADNLHADQKTICFGP